MSQKSNGNKKLKGLKLRTITIFLIIILLVLCSIFIVNIVRIRNGYEILSLTYENSVLHRQSAQAFKEGSYYLTEKVHLYVVTEEKTYAEDYFKELNVDKRRATAIEDLKRNSIEPSDDLQEAFNISNKLADLEIYAIRLVATAVAEEMEMDVNDYLTQNNFDEAVIKCTLFPADAALSVEGKRELAKKKVFGDEYVSFRNDIDKKTQDFLDFTYAKTGEIKNSAIKSLKSSIIQQSIFIALVLVITITYSICISWLVLKPLKIYIKCVREGRAFELLGAYEFKHLAITYNSIFEVQHETEKTLRKNAEFDPLTGLLNRGAYNRISEQFTNRDISVAGLIIDIDDFKTVNDTYGHAVGDSIIRSVGHLLVSNFRPSDIVARIGGDEFVVIMLDITIDSLENIDTRIRMLNKALSNPANDLPKTSLSVGVAFSEYGYSDELLKRADVALYQTKENGKSGASYNRDVITKPEEVPNTTSHKKSKK